MKTALLLFLASVCSFAYGQQKSPVLGEGPFEVERKCGKAVGAYPVDGGYRQVTYEPNGYRFTVLYEQNRAVCVRVHKILGLSEQDVAAVLSANSRFNEKWESVQSEKGEVWKRADDGAWAVRGASDLVLVVMEKRYAEKNDDIVKQVHAKQNPPPSLVR